MPHAADILILSNGPGELTTWVRPVVESLQDALGGDRLTYRISLVLSPCPNASGKEVAIARRYPGVDRIQGAEHFFPFLLFGKTAEDWNWHKRGVVIFLGGDQVYPILIGKRLGFRIIIYGEWDTRWHPWGDRYAVMNDTLVQKAPRKYAYKFRVIGDLMASAAKAADRSQSTSSDVKQKATGHPYSLPPSLTSPPTHPFPSPQIGFLPGSKPAKLAQGVPLCLAIAHHIHQHIPDARFVIPVAPTLNLETLARFANAASNPVLSTMGGVSAALYSGDEPTPEGEASPRPLLKTEGGVVLELHPEFPAYDLLRECQICVTTVGANTAELGALAVPMLVLLPTQQLEAMKAWDGLPGLLANLPGVGDGFARLINRWFLRKKRLLAWPNIWAGEEIVPELVGNLTPEDVGDRVLAYLGHPEQLQAMGDRLRQVRGQPGAADRLAQIVIEELRSMEI